MKKYLFQFVFTLIAINSYSQNVGIGTNTPTARLHITDSSVLFSAPGQVAVTPGNPPISGAGRRIMWYADKAAFRAGYVFGNNWNKDSVGDYSIAMGFDTKAKGFASHAMGYTTTALGIIATSMGYNTAASGYTSTAMGYYTNALSQYSTAMGSYTTASGNSSTAMGNFTTASGPGSTAMGEFTYASGITSTAMGSSLKAKSHYSTVIGKFNDTTATNRLFEIGNGTADNARINVLTVLNNGNTGIGTSSPLAKLHVADSSVLFSASGDVPVTPGSPAISGAGRRMMWYPDKAAFRSGYVDGALWDKANIGIYSFAAGTNTKASGNSSSALGYYSNASGDYSFAAGSSEALGINSVSIGSCLASTDGSIAIGSQNWAEGYYTTALGYNSIAAHDYAMSFGYYTSSLGPYSTSLGVHTTASGNSSFSAGILSKASGASSVAIGNNVYSRALGAVTLGSYNDTLDLPDPSVANASDRIFQLGNGTNNPNRKNAMTILRNGNTGIGTLNPGSRLHIAYNSSGYTGGNVLGMTLETNANSYFNILSPDNNESGILFGKASDYASGGIVYNNNAHLNGLEFRTNGNLTRMVLNNNGYLGVGVTDPAFLLDVSERMRIRSTPGLSAGLWLNNDINTTSPAFIGMKLNDEVGFYGQTGSAGWRFYINTTTGNGWMQGALTQNSDMRLKKNITLLDNSLQRLMQLHGYNYYWKDPSGDNALQTGVLAQEVQKLFPELVTENRDGLLAVNYSGLIPVMIESIKEQQKQIDELKKLVNKLLHQ